MKLILKVQELHVHHHTGCEAVATLLEQIMSTQAEIAARLDAVTTNLAGLATEVTKVGTETQTLLDKVGELTALLAQAGDVIPGLEAAVAAVEAQSGVVKTQLDVVDNLVADAPAP